MEIIKPIIIGIIQGLTEFLPISSTAHMTIFAKFFDSNLLQNPQNWTAFMAVVQLGTLVSLLVFFRQEIAKLTATFLNFQSKPWQHNKGEIESIKLTWQIIIGSVPIFILGFLLKDIIESQTTKSTSIIGTMLIFIAVIMYIADRFSKKYKGINQLRYIEAIAIGFAQAFALIPGVSRSGATISAGLIFGLKRETAAHFSFLLSIPAVAVSGIYEFVKYFNLFTVDLLFPTIIATTSAFGFGLLAIKFLLGYLKNHSTLIFVVYRIIVGLGILLFL